jgi:signal recognition particle receptor subunit beta
MVSINYAFREIISKIVYYGPGLSGKTTNLQYVFKKVPSQTRGELISLATDADRTLYFDFLPVNVGTIQGFATKFQLYTVPGQVYYNATRKLVLRGVDGLVFVADSQISKMDENIESLQNLKDNIEEYGYDINQLPMVIQYNKRDLPNIASIAELERILNPGGLPYFEASAVTGEGVFKTLKAISKMVLDQVRDRKMDQPKIIKTPSSQPKEEFQPQPPVKQQPPLKQQPPPQPEPSPPLPPPPPQRSQREQPRPSSAPWPQPAKAAVGVAEAEAPVHKAVEPSMPIKSQVISPAVEVPQPRIKSSDKIGTNNVESAVISDIPARVVVSDAQDDQNNEHEEAKPHYDLEETTERAVIRDEPVEADTQSPVETENIGITNDYQDVDPHVQSAQTKVWPSYGGESGDSDDMNNIKMKSSLPLRKPQMAESRKVRNKGSKFSLFGWLKKSKR